MRGGNLPTSRSRGSIDSLAISPSGTFISINSVMRALISSSDSTPSDMLMRRIDPNRLIATGNADRVPSISTGCSNSSALPPPGCFITRSAISQSSRFMDTGCVTRTSSPACSSCAMKSVSVSVLTWKGKGARSGLRAAVDGGDAERQRVPLDVGETRAPHPRGQVLLDRESWPPIAEDMHTPYGGRSPVRRCWGSR